MTKKNEPVEKIVTNKLAVKTSADFLGYKGSTPFIEVDENWVQMPLDRTKLTIPREHLTRMFPLAYFSGKLSGLQEGNKLGLVAILTFLLLFVGIGFTWFMNSGTSTKVEDLKGVVSSLSNSSDETSAIVNVDHQWIQMIAVKLNITTTNETIPTVEG